MILIIYAGEDMNSFIQFISLPVLNILSTVDSETNHDIDGIMIKNQLLV